MTRFATVLEQARERLRIPEPARTRILLEMASDLEDSYQHFLEQGCDRDEAARRAEEVFGSSDDALQLLERVYHAGCGGVGECFTQQIGTVWSKILLVAVFAFEILFAIRILTDRSFFVYPSPFLWPIAVLALAIILFTIWKLVQIFSPSGGDGRRMRTGLGIPLFFAGATLAVTVLGFLFHMQRYFQLNAEGAPETLFMNFAGWMVSISSMMNVGLLTATLAGLLWFVLSRLVARSEAREIEDLLRGAS